ncbi:MAG: hypothetical protein L7F78_19805, partial [Syntrophales bacterium LBB04]|nr:hypothetical protein [Syntrophales bacterium LBB04]
LNDCANASLDKPGDGHPHQVGGNEGGNADDQQTPVTFYQELNPGVIAENGYASKFLLFNALFKSCS